jgi:hypothetical protein
MPAIGRLQLAEFTTRHAGELGTDGGQAQVGSLTHQQFQYGPTFGAGRLLARPAPGENGRPLPPRTSPTIQGAACQSQLPGHVADRPTMAGQIIAEICGTLP